MSQMNYQQQSLTGATGLELVVALYDAAIGGLYRAIQCVEEDDTIGRRIAVKKVVDILMYLQARLRPDVGGAAAASLADFYAAMFTLTLEASHLASKEQFTEVIGCIRNVRDAWAIAAKDPAAGKVLPRELRTREETFVAARTDAAGEVVGASRWSA
ncbi:flagellar protein FliS [Granulicella sp. WH15]|uniref:flagellar export chaperone FliS n=1 Tax=Granulicella sp. WH15 TaxID=2602070 RepID=UPI001366BD55|nr:flagellar export chaperone FliS [Granulicella sp. WH15]QHN04051.1 flagellar protein FliS [Granulicella sp. WH15]